MDNGTRLSNEALTEQLSDRLTQSDTSPFLFVGSGLSRRYLQLEDWSGLLARFARLTNRPLAYYTSKAGGADCLPRAASLIAEAFYEVWWSDPAFAEERATLENECINVASPLKIQIAKYIDNASKLTNVPEELRGELDALRDAKVDGIITTNWDSLLEEIFPGFSVYVGQDDAIFERSFSIAEIFKIHGSCEKPNSLVLTEEDYESFNARNVYLAAKLTTTFLEHPVFFLGYSLHDENVKSILGSIVECLDLDRAKRLGERLFFVQYQRDEQESPSIGEGVVNVGNRDLHLTLIKASDFTPIYTALASIERRLSAKLLRQIKKHVYEIVATSDPTDRITVIDIDDLDTDEDIEFVVGVGISARISEKGLVPITIQDLYRDVVEGGDRFNNLAEELVSRTLVSLLQGNRKNVPVYKYLDLAGMLSPDGLPDLTRVPSKVGSNAMLPREAFEAKGSYQAKADELRGCTIDDLVGEYGILKALPYLTVIDVDIDALESFLRENSWILTDGKDHQKDFFRKLICIYDRRKYGPGFDAIHRRAQFASNG